MAQTILDRLNEKIAYKTIINTALHISPPEIIDQSEQ
jgi:hypothetical protein